MRLALSVPRFEFRLTPRHVAVVCRACISTTTSPADLARDSALAWPLQAGRAVEREFGRLKNEWALTPLRVRGIERVRLHADLTILAKLCCRMASERVVALAA
jgi:hypothetical protein